MNVERMPMLALKFVKFPPLESFDDFLPPTMRSSSLNTRFFFKRWPALEHVFFSNNLSEVIV